MKFGDPKIPKDKLTKSLWRLGSSYSDCTPMLSSYSRSHPAPILQRRKAWGLASQSRLARRPASPQAAKATCCAESKAGRSMKLIHTHCIYIFITSSHYSIAAFQSVTSEFCMGATIGMSECISSASSAPSKEEQTGSIRTSLCTKRLVVWARHGAVQIGLHNQVSSFRWEDSNIRCEGWLSCHQRAAAPALLCCGLLDC